MSAQEELMNRIIDGVDKGLDKYWTYQSDEDIPSFVKGISEEVYKSLLRKNDIAN